MNWISMLIGAVIVLVLVGGVLAWCLFRFFSIWP